MADRLEEFRTFRERMNARILEAGNLEIKRFFALDSRCYEAGALDVPTKELLGLVASMVLRCDDCITYHLVRCKEAGVTDFELASWNVLMAPKGTPAEVLSLLRQETALALADPRMRELYAAQGVETPAISDVKAFLAKERHNFGRVVRDLGITMD